MNSNICKNTSIIADHVSKERLMRNLSLLCGYHRIQASPGFRAAADFCCDLLKQGHIQGEILSYPAMETSVYGGYPGFQAWKCQEAWCDLVYPAQYRLADFSGNSMSLIQRSIACDHRDQPLDVVLLDRGSQESDYADVDFQGKVAFVRKMYKPGDVRWLWENRGAVGIITDHINENPGRSRYDLLDCMTYTAFTWEPGRPKIFGFVLSPREGDILAAHCRAAAAEGRCAQITCYSDGALYDGTLDVVSAYLPGKTPKEIVLTAHLCHPRYSANDNASGVVAALEAMRVIAKLVEEEKLAPLKYGIRMLLVPEFTGTYAYLDALGKQRGQMLAGINLDMVGGAQTTGYGPVILSDLPRSIPSFVVDLGALILRQLDQEMPSMGGNFRYSMINTLVGKFSGGSDHVVYADPFVGVPMPMLGQWPDRNYHTSGDVVSVIDPAVLHRSTSLAASYVYALATLGAEDIPVINDMAISRMVADLAELRANGGEGRQAALQENRELERIRFCEKSCLDYARFLPGDPAITPAIEKEQARIRGAAASLIGEINEADASSLFPAQGRYLCNPRRLFDLPLQHGKLGMMLQNDADREALAQCDAKWGVALGFYIKHFMCCYADGTRTLAEIARLVSVEADNVDIDALYDYMELLCRFGYMELAQ
mgnify:CR=1 FL=1